MPPRQQRQANDQQVQEIVNTLARMELAAAEREQAAIQREDGFRTVVTDTLNGLTDLVRDGFARLTRTLPINEPIQRVLRVPPADRIIRPRNCFAKPGFLRFLHDHLAEVGDHEGIYQRVSEIALDVVREMRNEQPELIFVKWRDLNHATKMEMARVLFEGILPQIEELEVIGRCVDLWPCTVVIQSKWTQMTSYQVGQRNARRGRQEQQQGQEQQERQGQ